MARIIKHGEVEEETARYRHSMCGAIVEFVKADVQNDRDGRYVICPACNKPPFIPASLLTWKGRSMEVCPKCGSADITDASQSLDCNSCGHSW